MLLGTRRLLSIKDLKDLRVFSVGVTIDMQDLKDLKRRFSRVRSRGTGPRATGQEGVLATVGRGTGPRHRSRYAKKTSLVLLGP